MWSFPGRFRLQVYTGLHNTLIHIQAVMMAGVLAVCFSSGEATTCDNCTEKINKFCCRTNEKTWKYAPEKKFCCDFTMLETGLRNPCNIDEDCLSVHPCNSFKCKCEERQCVGVQFLKKCLKKCEADHPKEFCMNTCLCLNKCFHSGGPTIGLCIQNCLPNAEERKFLDDLNSWN